MKKLTKSNKGLEGMKTALLAVAASSALIMSANADTIVTNHVSLSGVSWAYTIDDAENKAVTLVSGATLLDGTTSVDASLIPWTFTADDVQYTVTKVGASAFFGKTWLVGCLTVPDFVTEIGDSAFGFSSEGYLSGLITLGAGVTKIGSKAFKNQKSTTGILIKGNVTSIGNQAFGWAYALKNVLFANSSTTATLSQFLQGEGVTPKVFAPSGITFNSSDTSHVTIVRYGAGQDVDMDFDMAENRVTITPATELMLTNAIAWAANPFRSVYGLDTTISITNRISTSVAISESMLQDVTFKAPPWYLTFAVTTQAQLDNTLAAVSTDVPIIADITGAKEEITVPAGRSVAILTPGGATFNYHPRGLTISFH